MVVTYIIDFNVRALLSPILCYHGIESHLLRKPKQIIYPVFQLVPMSRLANLPLWFDGLGF